MKTAAVKIGMGQMLVKGGQAEVNLEKAAELVKQAADEKCDVVVLPECLDLGWTDSSALEKAQPIPGPYSDRLVKAAKENNIYVAAGLTEQEGDKIFNSAVLISSEGEILHVHRKINILKIAQHIYSIGDRLGVVETPFGTVGVNICADNFPNSQALGHSLARMGAQLILSPSAWAVEADHDNKADPYGTMWRKSYTHLAKLYNIAVVGVSNVGPVTDGPWKGRKCIGCSLAVSPNGEDLTVAPYGIDAEGLTTITVDIAPRKKVGTSYAKDLQEKGYEGP